MSSFNKNSIYQAFSNLKPQHNFMKKLNTVIKFLFSACIPKCSRLESFTITFLFLIVTKDILQNYKCLTFNPLLSCTIHSFKKLEVLLKHSFGRLKSTIFQLLCPEPLFRFLYDQYFSVCTGLDSISHNISDWQFWAT